MSNTRKRDALIALYAEVCVGMSVLTQARANGVNEAIDPTTREELANAFSTLYKWQDELLKATR